MKAPAHNAGSGHAATLSYTGVRSDLKEVQQNEEAVECVWFIGWRLFSLLSVTASVHPTNKHTFTNTHTYRAIELASSLRWNKTVPSAENRATEGKKPAVLIGIPSS